MASIALEMESDQMPQLTEGFTEQEFTEFYQEMAKMEGKDPAQVPELIYKLKKIYGKGRDFSDKTEFSRLYALFNTDVVSKMFLQNLIWESKSLVQNG